MKVSLDRAKCMGCGRCISICPEMFIMGEDKRAMVASEQVPQEWEDTVQQAVIWCPVATIQAE